VDFGDQIVAITTDADVMTDVVGKNRFKKGLLIYSSFL